METSDHTDRKRRRRKAKRKRTWARFFVKPRTFKFLVQIGIRTAQVLWVIYKIINFFLRE